MVSNFLYKSWCRPSLRTLFQPIVAVSSRFSTPTTLLTSLVCQVCQFSPFHRFSPLPALGKTVDYGICTYSFPIFWSFLHYSISLLSTQKVSPLWMVRINIITKRGTSLSKVHTSVLSLVPHDHHPTSGKKLSFAWTASSGSSPSPWCLWCLLKVDLKTCWPDYWSWGVPKFTGKSELEVTLLHCH